MNYKTLQRELKQDRFSPVYLFTGVESNIYELLTKEIIEKKVASGLESLNVNRYDQKETDYSEVLASFETLPVMSEKRIIILDEETKFFNQKDKAVVERIETYLKNPSQTTILIIRETKPDKRKRLFKLIKEYGVVVELDKLNFRELSSWIRMRLKRNKKRIEAPALERFIERSHYLENDSVDTLKIDQWVEQIVDFLGDQDNVTSEVIDEIIPAGVEENVFKIIELAVSGNLDSVRDELKSLWEHGESPIRIFALLLYQLRNITEVAILLNEHISQREIPNQVGLAPFIVNKLAPIARRYELNRLLEIISEAANLDYQIKTGKIDPEFGLEYFILKLNVKNKTGGNYGIR